MQELKTEQMKIRILNTYDDMQLQKRIDRNAELYVELERGRELIKAGVAELVEITKILNEDKVREKINALEKQIAKLTKPKKK